MALLGLGARGVAVIVKLLRAEDVSRELAAADRAAQGATRRAMLEAAAAGAEVLARGAPVDTGRLKQSFRLRRRGEGGHPEIVADAPYAGIVEAGSRPHWAPLAPLVRWVRRNAGRLGLRGAGRNRRSGRFTAGSSVVRVARAIQRKIARVGTRPRWFVRQRLPALRAILGATLRLSKATALAELARRGT